MSTAVSFAPVEATAGVPIRLAMQRLWLTGRILPAGARLKVQHVFRSEEAKPLEVIYSFPLPRDAVLRAFRIRGDGFEVHSVLKGAAVRRWRSELDGRKHPAERDGHGPARSSGGSRVARRRIPFSFSIHARTGISFANEGRGGGWRR